jgi:hypothetical protein
MLSVARLLSGCLAASVAAGQLVKPSNATLNSTQGGSEIQLSLIHSPLPSLSIYDIVSLAPNAGAGQDNSQITVRLLVLMQHIRALRAMLTTNNKRSMEA